MYAYNEQVYYIIQGVAVHILLLSHMVQLKLEHYCQFLLIHLFPFLSQNVQLLLL